MNCNISNDSVYFVSQYRTIAQGLSIIPTKNQEQDSWGVVSWFDKFNAYLRTIELKEAPVISNKSYKLLTIDNIPLKFKYINMKVYNKTVKPLLLDQPNLKNDEAI